MDYIEFSQKVKEKYPQYKDVDDLKLAQAMVKKYPAYESQVTFNNEPQKQGIDLTPSGLVKSGAKAVASGIVAPLTALKERKPLPEAYKSNYQALKDIDKEMRDTEKHPIQGRLQNANDFGMDIAGYTALPQVKVLQGAGLLPTAVNLGLSGIYQGGLIGGLDALKNAEDVGQGVKGGAAFGGVLGVGLPVGGVVAGKALKLLPQTGGFISRTIGRTKPETLEQAVKPNSKALDMNAAQAQQELMNTTEQVRNNYNELLAKQGNEVGALLNELPDDIAIKASDVADDISNTFSGYSLSGNQALNPAINAAQKELNKIDDLLYGGETDPLKRAAAELTPKELYDINKNIANMVEWDKPGAAVKNAALEQIYGQNANKLSALSPELAAANKEYKALMDFQKNEGLRRILRQGDNIDAASSALKNYNNTITKGNTGRNVQELEQTLVDAGYEPFINRIDDVNAAQDLLNVERTGDSSFANAAKILTRPVLRLARWANRRNLPPILQRIFRTGEEKAAPLLLYGGVSMDDER